MCVCLFQIATRKKLLLDRYIIIIIIIIIMSYSYKNRLTNRNDYHHLITSLHHRSHLSKTLLSIGKN